MKFNRAWKRREYALYASHNNCNRRARRNFARMMTWARLSENGFGK